MNFRVVVESDRDAAHLAELVATVAPLLGLPPDALQARVCEATPWIIDTADRDLARAIADRLALAFAVDTAVVPAIGQPSSRAAGFAAALDDLARRRAVENARRGLLRPQRRRPDPAEPPSTEPSAPPTAPPRAPSAPPEPAPAEETALDAPLELEARPPVKRRPRTPPPMAARPARRIASEPAKTREPVGAKHIAAAVLGVVAVVGLYLYLSDDGPPPDVGAADRELAGSMPRVVAISEQAWSASGRFPPTAVTVGAQRFPCTGADDPPIRPKRLRRGTDDWDNGAWMFVRFPPSPSYLAWSFESGGTGPYAWFVARAVGDLECDGSPTTHELLGYVRDGVVLHTRRSR